MHRVGGGGGGGELIHVSPVYNSPELIQTKRYCKIVSVTDLKRVHFLEAPKENVFY